MALCAGAPFGVFAIIYGLYTSQMFVAWVSAIVVILCMEGRVQCGVRMHHTALFWTHLASAVPFLTILSFLTFSTVSETVYAFFIPTFVVMVLSGAILWYQGLRAFLKDQH